MGGTTSNTETDFGASGGVGFTTESGFGFGVSVDLLIEEDATVATDNASRIGFSAGVNYRLGN